jgi:hypothetical protein
MISAGWLALAGAAWGADDPGARALQQQLLQRQQQQEALQLRMQQQQRVAPNPPRDARQTQAQEQLQVGQRQRQQELHYRQGIEPITAQPSDDAGTHRAKEGMELQRVQQRGQELLQRSGAEQQKN